MYGGKIASLMTSLRSDRNSKAGFVLRRYQRSFTVLNERNMKIKTIKKKEYCKMKTVRKMKKR